MSPSFFETFFVFGTLIYNALDIEKKKNGRGDRGEETSVIMVFVFKKTDDDHVQPKVEEEQTQNELSVSNDIGETMAGDTHTHLHTSHNLNWVFYYHHFYFKYFFFKKKE